MGGRGRIDKEIRRKEKVVRYLENPPPPSIIFSTDSGMGPT